MTVFAVALDALFADDHLARDMVYTAEGGAPSLVRAILRRPDDVAAYGEARLWSETTRRDLRVAEITNPRPGERVESGGEGHRGQSEPGRDRARRLGAFPLRPA